MAWVGASSQRLRFASAVGYLMWRRTLVWRCCYLDACCVLRCPLLGRGQTRRDRWRARWRGGGGRVVLPHRASRRTEFSNHGPPIPVAICAVSDCKGRQMVALLCNIPYPPSPESHEQGRFESRLQAQAHGPMRKQLEDRSCANAQRSLS